MVGAIVQSCGDSGAAAHERSLAAARLLSDDNYTIGAFSTGSLVGR